MQIVKHYTGNPMLNNALMTVKALAGLSSISELTTEVLKEKLKKVYDENPYSLMDLNLRFKSYTMLFTKNGPLYNDKKLGKQIYQKLMLKIVDSYEDDGDKICDLSGLRYNKSFSQLFAEVLLDLGTPEKELTKKDLTLNRCWFPLLGGLGSDAQALPMAKYTYNVHPIFIVILQFLPLSALVYKKGLLLVDSSNIEFCEYYIEDNFNEVKDRLHGVSSTLPIENIKDFTRGHYLIKALNEMVKSKMDFDCSEFSFWSFSNSGAGASCNIDRIPNELLLKLETLYIRHKDELTQILHNSMFANGFLDCLDSNKEWSGLYPYRNYEGVSVDFFESYWEVIGQKKDTEMAKYIAYLISKYKSDTFDKYLNEKNAYDCTHYNYKNDLNKVLLLATENGEWSLKHQLYIQDDKDSVPILFASYHMYRFIHFYYQHSVYNDQLPKLEVIDSNQARTCRWVIDLISKDSEKKQIDLKNQILNTSFSNSIFDELFIRHADDQNVSIYTVYPVLFDDKGKKDVWGLWSLLRYYYTTPTENLTEDSSYALPEITIVEDYKQWFESIDAFVMAYIRYRMHKVINEDKRGEYMKKIFKSVPKDDFREQRIWFKDILDRLNDFGKEGVWDEDTLIYDPMGNYNFSTFIYAVRMKLSKVVYEYSKVKTDN